MKTSVQPRTFTGPCLRRGSPPSATAALMLAVTACGGRTAPTASMAVGGQGTGVPALAVNEAAAQLLPESIRATKVLRVAIPTNEPPTQFYREGTQEMTGTNPDVARLIGAGPGREGGDPGGQFRLHHPGMAAGRYDMTVSSMTPTTKRMEVLDFVDYMQMGNSIAVPRGNPLGIDDEQSLCGKKVGLLTGSYQLTVNVPEYDEEVHGGGQRHRSSAANSRTRGRPSPR